MEHYIDLEGTITLNTEKKLLTTPDTFKINFMVASEGKTPLESMNSIEKSVDELLTSLKKVNKGLTSERSPVFQYCPIYFLDLNL